MSGRNPRAAATHRPPVRRWALLGIALLAALVCGEPAQADFGFTAGHQSVTLSTTQAGGHPDLTVAFALNQLPITGVPDGSARTVEVQLPSGVVGNATAAPRCTEEDVRRNTCPAAAQVGLFTPTVWAGFPYTPFTPLPLYNVVPQAGYAAELAVNLFQLNVYFKVKVDPTTSGMTTVANDIPVAPQVMAATVALWGVPADASHDAARGGPANVAPTAFLTNGFECGRSRLATFRADSWAQPGQFLTDTSSVPAFTGCDALPRTNASLDVKPDSQAAAEPSGYDITLRVSQNDNPHGLDAPPLKNVSVTLPKGVAISPSGADGLQACRTEDVHFGSDAPPDCPDASKLGTVTIVTPDLPEPLTGFMYLGAATHDVAFPMILTAQANGVSIKVPGRAVPDPVTGQVTTVFEDNPALPFSELHIHMNGGPRAVLSNPSACGDYTSSATVTPWGGGDSATATKSYSITTGPGGGPCPSSAPFAPTLTAGVANAAAGASSAFMFRLQRADGDQALSKISSVKLPDGLLASLKTVGMCSDAAVAAAAAHTGVQELDAPSCPGSSRIGTVRVGSGPGSHPLYLPGTVYLTGPYNGAPFGLAIVVPAVAGPIDLGTVVTRASVNVDRSTTALGIDTDALPTILGGVPLQLRDIMLTIDRPEFMVNPTSCAPQSVGATISSTAGAVAALSSRFQLGDCQALAFSPQLAMSLTGAKETKANGHPGLVADVYQPAGQANLRQVRVALPTTVGVDINNLGIACKAAQAAKGSCPATAIVGRAAASTPILPHALDGDVYLVEGQRTDPKTGKSVPTLPRLWVPLRGDIALDLWADTDVHGRVITTFSNIPDAPISAFHLEIFGGAKGILTNAKSLCAATQQARQEIDGQNGKTADADLLVAKACGLQVLSTRATGRRLTLRIGGVSPGRLSISLGDGGGQVTRQVHDAQVATVGLVLTRFAQQQLGAGRGVSATVRFRPAGATSTQTIRRTVRSR